MLTTKAAEDLAERFSYLERNAAGTAIPAVEVVLEVLGHFFDRGDMLLQPFRRESKKDEVYRRVVDRDGPHVTVEGRSYLRHVVAILEPDLTELLYFEYDTATGALPSILRSFLADAVNDGAMYLAALWAVAHAEGVEDFAGSGETLITYNCADRFRGYSNSLREVREEVSGATP